MMEQRLQMIAEEMKIPHTNLGLLQGQMGNALFFYNYARSIDPKYEIYADTCLDKVIEGIQEVNSSYANGLAGIGTGIEYLVRNGFIKGNTNEILSDLDKTICFIMSSSSDLINMQTGIGYGKYYLARLKSLNNNKNTISETELIKTQLSKVVDILSKDYLSFEDLYFVMDFLPDIISLNINKEKALIYFNHAVNLLETMAYEDTFFNNYPTQFNPLISSTLIIRSSKKNNNKNLEDPALFFLEKYESDFRPYLAEEYAIKWSFLYHILWETYNNNVYKKLSKQWLEKSPVNRLNIKYEDLTISGMMLLSISQSINDDWLDWFPLI